MKNYWLVLIILVFSFNRYALAEDERVTNIGNAGIAALVTSISKADIVFTRSLIYPNAFRGSLGESIASRAFLKGSLQKAGNWRSITPRTGSQGLDHLFIKTDKNGFIKDILVGETKYNTSRLGTTLDGIQMSSAWQNNRLGKIGGRYLKISEQTNMQSSQKLPLSPNRQVSVVLKNGNEVHFWANSSMEQWRFSGTQEQLDEARRLAKNYGVYFKKAGEGAIIYRSRIFNVIPKGNDLEIVIYQADNVSSKSLQNLAQEKRITVPNALLKNGALLTGVKDDIARVVQSETGLSDSDSRKLASKVLANSNAKQLMTSQSYNTKIFLNSGGAAAITIGIDAIIQLIMEGRIDGLRVSLSGGSVFAGALAGQYTHVAMTRSSAFRQLIARQTFLNTSTSFSAVSSITGAAITSVLLSYGLWTFGYTDLTTANRGAIIGLSSAIAGWAFSAGVMAAISTWGTASTGVAIASLSGAAATNASFAVLGGGTLAAGGGGVALGTAILTGGVVIVMVGASYLGYKAFQWYDEREESKSIAYWLNRFNDAAQFDELLDNSSFIKMKRVNGIR